MDNRDEISEDLIQSFREREKELRCLYKIEEILKEPGQDQDQIYSRIIEAIPYGWQYPESCRARITLGARTYQPHGFEETPWVLKSDINLQNKKAGEVSVYYTREMPAEDDGPFLKHEKRLLEAIADRLGSHILHLQLQETQESEPGYDQGDESDQWQVILNLLRHTDKKLHVNLCERMLNHLNWSGITEVEDLEADCLEKTRETAAELVGEVNQPQARHKIDFCDGICEQIFHIAAKHYTDKRILDYLQKWIADDKLKFLVHVANRNITLPEVISAIRRYRDLSGENIELSSVARKGVIVSLIRKFLSSQLNYISIAKKYLSVEDFFKIIDSIIYIKDSRGRLGGKTAGLFLAEKIIRKSDDSSDLLKEIKTPRSWYITSDVLLGFLKYNNMDEVVEQKYKDIKQVRMEYPYVVRTFKNGSFPPEIVQMLSMLLDEFDEKPLIVRSSSLLEDSLGAAFSGKYKSLFLANQGSKQKRLEDLMDAIAEVYSSTFGPDPIQYRAERNLLDFAEEMGIIIQEVVGNRVGDYFLPAFAGVAFSRNDFRWSSRIKREDGLMRMVPGLGTRAVDRISEDYPVLVAPGQPSLKVNVTPEEVVYYSPRKIDLINLRTRSFETVDIRDLIREHGSELPLFSKMVSRYEEGHLRRPLAMNIDYEKDDLVITFDGLISKSKLVEQMDGILNLLSDKLQISVDVEFAHDGRNLYLLQCRPQSFSDDSSPAAIPKDLPEKRIVFSAHRYISNGRVPDLTHIVYVEPEKYSQLSSREELMEVGRAVGELNKLLPKRRFILMGPGRWGSRGDIKLGVSVTYSDINNTAVLTEIARKKGNYMPDLSFGTHFFQDLVEGQIRYLPLYPDNEGNIFNQKFLLRSRNILPDTLPKYSHLEDVIRLIDVPEVSGGMILRVLMNADLNEAVGVLMEPEKEQITEDIYSDDHDLPTEKYWLWRLRMAQHIASELDPGRFGVAGFYVFGSTKNATAGLSSDIDLLIHFRGTDNQRKDLESWLEGWSLCLDEINYLRTGYRVGGLLDVHIVTDEDIRNKTSYAVKIGAVTDPAREIPLGKKSE
ncbi:MAG: pyruvate, phosphate dikinase [Candidatus Latescibacteria bacterium]|nr:pyruvate, phosphate dikinase [bacterium]MBD3424593.1 pyruvate, phosphate dikinase [Candidatus Latescibacterota bacterium]